MDMHVQNRPQIFFAKVPAEQTPQLCNLSVQTNRKNKFKKYNTPCHVQPFLLSFLMSGSPTTTYTTGRVPRRARDERGRLSTH